MTRLLLQSHNSQRQTVRQFRHHPSSHGRSPLHASPYPLVYGTQTACPSYPQPILLPRGHQNLLHEDTHARELTGAFTFTGVTITKAGSLLLSLRCFFELRGREAERS